MLEVILTVRLVLNGPILSHSTSIGAIGIDAPMARDSDNRYYLPFSLVRGRLRQSWEELQEATNGAFAQKMDDLLGPRPGETTDRTPRRGRLHFSDFRHESDADASGILHRIRMDAARGAADKGALQTIESPFLPGQRVAFTGTISYRVNDSTSADAIRSDILTGLRWTTHFGGERTVGFGRLLDVELLDDRLTQLQVAPVTGPASNGDALYIAIRPLAPFCVAKRRVNPNLFESDTILSGAVLRGSLATTLQSLCGLPRDAIIDASIPSPWQELGAHFDDITFAHAFPAPEASLNRPVVAPFSLVKCANEDLNEDLYDVALCKGPGLIGNPPLTPNFAVDWKKTDDVQSAFGWAEPKLELRVRTAIDRTRRRAEDEKLFAYEMVVPRGCLWHGKVDLSRVPPGETRTMVEMQLRTLLSHGLWSIGKTKAMAEVKVFTEVTPLYPSTPNPLGNLWVATLQTPALLCDPVLLREESRAEELFAAYDMTWQDMSGGALKLTRFFATQSLAGGYLVKRFQSGKPYNPFLLTDAGSVFVLHASGEIPSGQAVIENWLWNGLPLPQWAEDRYGNHWSTCPFLPENGFGEIAVNLPCYTEKQPPKEVFHGV